MELFALLNKKTKQHETSFGLRSHGVEAMKAKFPHIKIEVLEVGVHFCLIHAVANNQTDLYDLNEFRKETNNKK